MPGRGGAAAPAPSFLVLGLGNPGSQYADTRHNLGFRVVGALAESARVRLSRGPGPYRLGSWALGPDHGLLAEPTTFMNRSGLAGRDLLDRFGVALARWLVVCDDLDLPLGRVRFRAGGGDGGHKGLRSLIEELGTREFPRLRLGIGRPEDAEVADVVDHVLDPFRSEEREAVEAMVARGAEGVRIFVREGLTAAANRFNGTSLDPPGALR